MLSIKLYHQTPAQPVEEANIEIKFVQGFKEGTTDSEGVFNFTLKNDDWDIEAGEVLSIKIYKAGFAPKELQYTVQKDADRLWLNLEKEAFLTIYGYVRDPFDGKFLGGVDVSYRSEYRTSTADNGFYQLDIPLHLIDQMGTGLVVIFRKEGYLDASVDEKLGRNERSLQINHTMQRPVAEEEGVAASPPPPRDAGGKVYTTITLLDDQRWLAQNVQAAIAAPNTSWCYDGDDSRCEIYGRLYTWEGARKACAQLGEGWRLPTAEEWEKLAEYYGGYRALGGKDRGDPKAAYKLMTEGEFDVPLGGRKLPGSLKFTQLERSAYYWTGSVDEVNPDLASYFRITEKGVLSGVENIEYGMSCRCIKD